MIDNIFGGLCYHVCYCLYIDLWSHALSISCNKILMSGIEKSVSLFCEIRKLLSMTEAFPQQKSIADTTL